MVMVMVMVMDLVPLSLTLLRPLPLSGTVRPELLLNVLKFDAKRRNFEKERSTDLRAFVGGAGLGTTSSFFPSVVVGSFSSAATTTTLPSSSTWFHTVS